MSKPITITGSLAYDHVMTFKGEFKDHILPDKIHMLNVAFNIDTLDVDLGGTAGNIAHSLVLLGENVTIHATVGNDFERYEKALEERGLSTRSIKVLTGAKMAQAFITTDTASNQITAFHGGAMYRAHEHPLTVTEGVVIVSPNGTDAMFDHAAHCREQDLRFIFDPGQAMNALAKEELIAAVECSAALTVNDYEWQWWQEKTGLSQAKTLELTGAVIVTLGDQGSRLILAKDTFELPAISGLKVVDPTGSGDAFRAGLLYGLSRDWDWEDSMKIGTTLASFCVESQGPQNHSFTSDEFQERFKKAFS